MPINLRYGQQAVARGFLNQQRLQQVLSKQKQLAAQGKKVSVRMILEKAKLLTPAQLSQIDHDLNIKVVKKRTGVMNKPADAPRKAAGPTGAQNFKGEAVPEFTGMSGGAVEATLFSPPPADMQDRIRKERDRASANARARHDEEAAGFFGDDHASPFGSDPFADDAMSPEPAGGTVEAEMEPEPVMGRGDLHPQPASLDEDEEFSDTPRELSRMESSPKISALSAEVEGFTSPEDEELPAVSGFGDDTAAEPEWQPPKQPTYAGPPSAEFAPAANEFDDFGNDIRSPEELESGTPARPARGVGATMFSPKPPGLQPREAEPEPEGEAWGESGLEAEPAFGESGLESEPAFGAPGADADMDATVFSPPPPEIEERRKATRESYMPGARGRQGADSFADIDLPTGKRMDDVPTAPAQGEDIHPLRRGVGTSSSAIPRRRTTSRKIAVPDDFGADDAIDTHLPEVQGEVPAERGPGKMPPPKLKKSDRSPKAKSSERKPKSGTVTDKHGKKKRSTSSRVILLFLLLLVIVLALLITPVAYHDDRVPQLKELRDHPRTKPIYDYVEKVYKPIRELLGLPDPNPKPKPQVKTIPGDASPTNAPSTDEPSNGEPAGSGN
jgi:hypothetical protein